MAATGSDLKKHTDALVQGLIDMKLHLENKNG